MIGLHLPKQWRWAGLVVGVLSWYAAHDLAFYLSAYNCKHVWILPTMHLFALGVCLYGGRLSCRAYLNTGSKEEEAQTDFISGVCSLAAGLFSIVILWQGIATLVFHGCSR